MNNYSWYTDGQLAALLKEGDGLAYTEIFERYKVILYKHAYRLLGDEDESNDIVQDLFLALWQKRGSLALTSSLSSYLYGSVRNRIFDLLSHQKVITRYLDSVREFVERGEYVTDERLRSRELAELIEREIAALPPRMREVFELSRNEELSYREIGEKLGISEGTVKLQVHNAVKNLRGKIRVFLSIYPFL